MNIDRSIPFYNMIFRCRGWEEKPVLPPDGISLRTWQPGDELAWARLETELGDFATVDEAADYFRAHYLAAGGGENCVFAVDGGGSVLGSVIAWYDMRGEERVASLHWLVVEESRQRQGIGRALLRRAMNFYRTRGETCVYLHTQPWSWRACLLYAAEGFRWQKRDTFAGYENQFGAASETLRNVLPADAYAVLLASAEE